MDISSKVRRKIHVGRNFGNKLTPKDVNQRDVGRDRIFTESRSDTSEKIIPEGIKLENTYKLTPDEGKRFVCGIVERKMKEILEEQLKDMNYHDATGSSMATDIATQIKKELQQFPWNRYKYVVQVAIGQNKEQDIKIGSRCLWNHKTDNFASASYSNKTLFAVVSCFAIYFE